MNNTKNEVVVGDLLENSNGVFYVLLEVGEIHVKCCFLNSYDECIFNKQSLLTLIKDEININHGQ